MKIFVTDQIRQLDALTIEREPISSVDLMERAARAITQALTERWSTDTTFTVFAGPGNNGGDALAVSRLLAQKGYRISVYLFNIGKKLSDDCAVNADRLKELSGIDFHEVTSQFVFPKLTADDVIIDGLFGSGLNKPLAGGFALLVKSINASPARVVSIDLPSGLMGEDNTYNQLAHIVRADWTLTLQQPKLAFLFAENAPYVGEWQVLDIGLNQSAIDELPTSFYLSDASASAALLKPRNKFAHKGMFGRALLIAGSQGMAGASILAARACLRSGVGLLKVHVPFCNNLIVQTAVPEATTEIDLSDTCFADVADTDPYQAVGIGPGIGRSAETVEALLGQIVDCAVPMVLDADALNILSEHRDYLSRLPKGSVLTPHPKELERLVGSCRNSYERLMKACELAQATRCTVILKGAYSAVVSPDGTCRFNTTGNPGMATGGSGDVLTGIVLALLAQGYAGEEAALLATCVHGLAGDVAAKKYGQIGMTAGDIVTCLPVAWRMLEKYGKDHTEA